jgi:site-specific DNA-methyltransferase (adenine-specific)
LTELLNKVTQGDCLEVSGHIESGSVDLILTDLPYGNMRGAGLDGWSKDKTNWDFAIEPSEVYKIANRILRKNGKMVLFSQEPYTSRLINEAIPNVPFSYRMVWEKDHFANSLIAKKAPVSYYEDILVFAKVDSGENNEVKNYLVIEKDKAYADGWTDKTLRELCGVSLKGGGLLAHYWGTGQWMMPTKRIYLKLQETEFFKKPYEELQKMNQKNTPTFNLWEGKKYKSNVLKYKKDYDGFHPTQKPVLLLEDLIKTFSNEGDLVIDLTCGSGSTCVAAINTGRQFIGIEREPEYVEIANKRIAKALAKN